MNQKFRVMVGLCGMLMLLSVVSIPALTQEYSFKTVANIAGSTNTETGNPAAHLIDDNSGSFWKLAPGSTEGWVELHLSEKTLIHGLKISGGLASDTELTLEYLQGEQWTRFLVGIYKNTPLNGIIDLSYDKAVTERLRIRLTGTGTAYTQLNEIKIIGEAVDEVLHQINPKSLSASGHTSYLTQEEFLNDGNTYTYWMVKPRYRSGNNWLFVTLEGYLGIKPDYNYNFNWPNCPSYYNRGDVIFEMATAEKISNINIFFTEDTRGDLTIETQEKGVWKKIGFIPQSNQPGWHRTAFEPAVVSSKIRLVMEATGHESVGGISEVQFWGYGNFLGDQHLDLGPQTAQSLNTAINRQFKLKKAEAQNYRLNFAVSGDELNETLPVDLNGVEYSAVKSAEVNGHSLYYLTLTETMLDNDCNYLKIKPLAGFLDGLKLTSRRDGVEKHQVTDLNDGLLLTPGKNVAEQIVILDQKVLVEQVEVYITEEANLTISYRDGDRWTPVNIQPPASSGWISFKASFITDQLKISNSSQVSLNEVRVLGSGITDHAPIVRLIRPCDYEVYDTDQISDKYLIGFVDNPRAKVKVNGKDVHQIGHYFGFHLTAVGASTWEDTIVEAVAVDPQGRVGRYQTHMIIDKLPWLQLDQAEKTAFSGEATFRISGEVVKPNCVVKVNGQTVADKKGTFSTLVDLKEGFNLIKIECDYTKPGNGGGKPKKDGFTQTFYRKVVRFSGQVKLEVYSPLNGSWISANNVNVSGYAFGLGTLKVWVNNQPAVVNGESFSLPVKLVEEKNVINIKAQDERNQTANASLTVWRDTIAPKIAITEPKDQFISNLASIIVKGTVTDTFPACITVNGTTAGITGDIFDANIILAEGWNTVTVKAWDAAGNGSQKTIKVLVDTVPPEPFEVTADPSDWTSNTRPILTFGTTDATSGISQYLLAIDGGAFTQVTSPYQLPTQADGEHTIVIKAVDKAGWETESAVKVYIDTTPPVKVSEFKTVPGDKKIIVSWKPNPEEDITKYVLKRVPEFSDGEKLIEPDIHEYIDTAVENLSSYTYSIHAVDHAANQGPVVNAPTVKAGLAEIKADPAKETKIEYENVIVGVPVGALPQSKTVTITEVKHAEPIKDDTFAINISPVYSLGVKSTQGIVEPGGTEFSKPVLVGIHFDLKNEYQCIKKSTLKAYYYNYKNENWEIIPESYVNGETNTVFFLTKHFSMFSVKASLATPLAPEQISEMGISPSKSYYQNNQVGISYSSGASTVSAKDFVLPGKGGLDLSISRTYDSITGQGDWGLEESTVFQTLTGFFSANTGIPEMDAWLNVIKNLVARQIDKYLAEPSGSYGFGRGWRMNFVWVEKNDDGQFLHLPGGGMKKINWTMDGPGWGGQGHARFECHVGEHFIIEKNQVKNCDLYADDDSSMKVGEDWSTTGYFLTTKDGTKYYMHADGRLDRIVNRLGTSEIMFFYNGKQVDYILDSVGRRIEFNYQGKFIKSITGAGKTVNYQYNNGIQELEAAIDGGIHRTQYRYEKYELSSGSQTISLMDMVSFFYNPTAWINLISSLIPDDRKIDVHYLSSVKTPFGGEYRIAYEKIKATRYDQFGEGLGVCWGMMWFEFCKAKTFQEIGSAYTKTATIDYTIQYDDNNSPTVASCNIYEGKRRTYMMFERYSNSVDKDASMLKCQVVYGEKEQIISAHLVDEFDYQLEVPLKVIDQTGDRGTIQEFKYDNWGNVVWQKNSHTQVEAFYSYANTLTPVTYPSAMSSPYKTQSISGVIHDAKTGEYILNNNGGNCIPQQTYYNYDTNGNLLEKAVHHDNIWLRTSYTYDTVGNITKSISPSGIETYFEYSDTYQNALLTKVTLNKLTNADGEVQTNVVLKELGYDTVSYRKRWEKDARGCVTEHQQDTLGREVMTVLPDDSDPADYRPSIYSGDIDRSGCRADNPVQQISYNDSARTTTIIDPNGNRTDYIYDTFDHMTEIIKYKRGILGFYNVYSQAKVAYDEQGNIREITSPEGCKNPDVKEKYTTTYLYDEMNRLKEVIYPKSENETENPFKYYSYNDIANEITVFDENGHQIRVKKDAVDRVVEQIAGYGSEKPVTTKFTYDSLGNKTSETDGKGYTTTFIYDDMNQLVKKIFPEAETLNNPSATPERKSSEIKYVYDSEGNMIREVTPLGTVIKHYYDEMNREIKTETQFTGLDGVKKTTATRTYYDLAGNKTKTIDPNGKATEFQYTARGWLKKQIDPTGGVISFDYDTMGNKIRETDPRGNVAGAVQNSYTAWYYYDELYRVVKAVLPDSTPPTNPDNPGDNPVITFDYDLNGNCRQETKVNGQVITYNYDGRNRLLSETQSLDGKTYTTRIEYDGVGNKRFITDNKDNKTEYRYDAHNRLVLEIFPEGNTVEYDYDNNGNKSIVRDGKHNETRSEYDELNRLVRVIDADSKVTENWYNEEGRLTKTKSPTGLVTMFHLNEIGLPLEVIDSLSQRRFFDYDVVGNNIYKKDPRGTETRFTYDDLYRVLRTDLQNGTRQQYLSYEYDLVGNIKQVDNGQVKLVYNNADSVYESDPFNRIKKVSQVMPGGFSYSTEYRYDQIGQMTGIRYPNSAEWLTYEYDKMGRLTAIPGFAGTKSNPGFTYDENNALQSIKTTNGILTTYQRDKNGRILNIEAGATSSSSVLTLNYLYDHANNIIKRNDNSYIYDKLNRLQHATVYGVFEDKFTKADMLMGTADQDYHGDKEVEEDVTDQTQIKLDFAARSLILDLQTDAENISKVELIPEVTGHRVPVEQIEIFYRYGISFVKLARDKWVGTKDGNGRITIKFIPLLETGELKIHCNYDDLNLWQMPLIDRSEFYNSPEKLVTVYQKAKSRTESYVYDAMGNRTEERLLLHTKADGSGRERQYSYQYYENSNRLKQKERSDGSERYDYEYDANGNLTVKIVTKGEKINRWEYAYDLLNQLEQVKKNGEVISSYIYDPNGFRVEKVGSKGKIHYVPLLNGEVGYRKEFSTNAEYSFVYVGIQHLARINGVIGGNGKKFFYHNDHLGSSLAVTDEYGNKVVERDFTPFGERINTDVYDDEPRDIEEDDSGFTGKDWDEDAELYYYNARWYDPGVGRFISEDSVMDDPNLYGYCHGNPVNYVDPSGHSYFKANWVGGITNLIGTVDPNLGQALGTFKALLGTVDGIKWASFVEKYTSMNAEQFKAYLKEQGINYNFEENNASKTTFLNTEGQKPLTMSMFASIIQKTLIGDQKLLAFQAMEGNIAEFLKNNPGLSLVQVRSLFDAAVLSSNNPWGFGKNEFRFEGRGSGSKDGLYNAEAVIMNEGMIMGVLTNTSTEADPGYESLKAGIYDYEVARHHVTRYSKESGGKDVVLTEIGQEPPKDPDTGKYYTYQSGVDKDNQPIYKSIDKWWKGTYKALYISNVNGRTAIMSHAGFAMNNNTETGSQGCPTTYYMDYLSNMNLFNDGDKGKFIVIK